MQKQKAFPRLNVPYPVWLGLPAGGDVLLASCGSSILHIAHRGQKGLTAISDVRGDDCHALSPDGTEGVFAERALDDAPAHLGIYDAHSGAIKHKIKAPNDAQSIAWSPTGTHVAASFWPDTIAIWSIADVRAGKAKPLAKVKNADIANRNRVRIAFTADGKDIVFQGDRVAVFLGLDLKVRKRLALPPWINGNIVVSSTGDFAALTGVFDAKGKRRWAVEVKGPADDPPWYADLVAFTPDGSKLVCVGNSTDTVKPERGMAENGFVAIHDARTGKRLGWLPRTNKREARSIAMNDEMIAVAPNAKAVEIYRWDQFD